MLRIARHHRKIFAFTLLGVWGFAVFAGIANACSREAATAVPHQPVVTAHSIDDAGDGGVAPGCHEFGGIDAPIHGVFKPVQEQPAGDPLKLAHQRVGVLPISAPPLYLARTAHPLPGVPFFVRTVRLTL